MCKDHQERDELRARFTAWIEILAYRVRLNYLRDRGKGPITVLLEDLPEGQFTQAADVKDSKASFDFEEERLAKAFSNLPPMKKQVLTMLFVLEKRPDEIAKELGCTVQNVYNQRSLALARLRTALKGGEESD